MLCWQEVCEPRTHCPSVPPPLLALPLGARKALAFLVSMLASPPGRVLLVPSGPGAFGGHGSGAAVARTMLWRERGCEHRFWGTRSWGHIVSVPTHAIFSLQTQRPRRWLSSTLALFAVTCHSLLAVSAWLGPSQAAALGTPLNTAGSRLVEFVTTWPARRARSPGRALPPLRVSRASQFRGSCDSQL